MNPPFDIDNPELPAHIKDNALASGGYAYRDKMDKHTYRNRLYQQQLELVKLQADMRETGKRIVIVFEGRDAAGKGGNIATVRQYLNPRYATIIALPKPSDVEQKQWYFQRYIAHLPAQGHMSLFDRSWYNRGGVEPVMGFCTDQQHKEFLKAAPNFEKQLVDDGIILIKFWLNIGQEMQMKRFHDRRHNPLKRWKLSPMDIEALTRFENYTAARNLMLKSTHTEHAPWHVVLANDKRRARLAVIQHILSVIDYQEKDVTNIGETDTKVSMEGTRFLATRGS